MKIGRNELCPCGSGKKFKKCCADGNIVGLYVRDDGKHMLFKRGFVVNQLRRDAPAIAKTFDQLCSDDLAAMDKYAARCNSVIIAGTDMARSQNVEWRERCGWLLQNALSDFLAATDLARDGFILQPGILVRHVLELVTAVLCITVDMEHWEAFKANKLRPEREIATATRVLPVFGRLYGELSGTFAHVRQTHGSIHPVIPYSSRDYEPLMANLRMIKIALWLIYVVTEVVFYDIAKPIYWKALGSGQYEYVHSDAGSAMEKELFGKDIDEA